MHRTTHKSQPNPAQPTAQNLTAQNLTAQNLTAQNPTVPPTHAPTGWMGKGTTGGQAMPTHKGDHGDALALVPKGHRGVSGERLPCGLQLQAGRQGVLRCKLRHKTGHEGVPGRLGRGCPKPHSQRRTMWAERAREGPRHGGRMHTSSSAPNNNNNNNNNRTKPPDANTAFGMVAM